jgi:hypothetical protein
VSIDAGNAGIDAVPRVDVHVRPRAGQEWPATAAHGVPWHSGCRAGTTSSDTGCARRAARGTPAASRQAPPASPAGHRVDRLPTGVCQSAPFAGALLCSMAFLHGRSGALWCTRVRGTPLDHARRRGVSGVRGAPPRVPMAGLITYACMRLGSLFLTTCPSGAFRK